MDIIKTLQALNRCHGPSGDERGVSACIQELAAPYADEIRMDTLGNLIVHKKGSGPKIMFSAHMDSIGLITTHIEENGFLRFGRLGGLNPFELLATPVRFQNGVRGVIGLDGKTKHREMKLDDLYIDIGAKDEKEARSMVQVGDTAVYDTPVYPSGSRIFSPYMDNRISCVVLLTALEQLNAGQNDLYFVFSTQEELGLRGARTAAFGIEPDYGIAVDVTDSDDIPNAPHDGSSVFGGGAAIKVMDSSVICHPAMVSKLEEIAREKGIKTQRDVLRAGGTDAGAIHQIRAGVVTGGISIPCRYIHTPIEVVESADVLACASLVAAVAQADLDKGPV